MKIFNKVVIIGTGLIGGSVGLGLRKKHLAKEVIGLSRKKANANLAKKLGAIDSIGRSLDVVADADLIILATPVDSIIKIASEISKNIKKNCIVIDVGSTKEMIVAKLSRIIPNFVGCHPLAGLEKKGIANIQANIFNDSICIITPTLKTNKNILNKIALLWKSLGAKAIVLSARKHDQILACTSHLPHAVAFSLIKSIPEEFFKLSSKGLKDTTRIAASDAHLWSQIFFSNRRNLLTALAVFQIKLNTLILALKNNDKKLLIKILKTSQNKRRKLG